jgi:Zn-dependent peptidase ImmA (M78 family)
VTRVEVSSAVLRWALDRSGKATAIFERFPKLRDWLENRGQPTLRQLENLSRATYVPLGYFFLSDPPDERLPIPHFRTLAGGHPSRPSANLLDTVQTMQRRQAWVRDYLIEEGEEPLAFIGSAKSDDKPLAIAENMRVVLGLREGWAAPQATWTAALRDLQKRIETASILVVANGIVGNNTHRKLDPEEFRGFVLVDEYAPLVFLNGADFKAAQVFTLAHELAHLWIGSSAAFDLRELRPANDESERTCDRIAAEFLIPEQELRQVWPEARRESDRFQVVARHFKVSEIVAARRALDLALINTSEFREFYTAYAQRERQKASVAAAGGDFYATQNLRVGRRFAETVVRAAREGRLLYRDAYQLTGLHGGTFERYAEELELGESG